MHSPLLTQSDATKLLRLSVRSLERLRCQGGGPKYIKAGRSVRYRSSDLEIWLNSETVGSTSEISSGSGVAS